MLKIVSVRFFSNVFQYLSKEQIKGNKEWRKKKHRFIYYKSNTQKAILKDDSKGKKRRRKKLHVYLIINKMKNIII